MRLGIQQIESPASRPPGLGIRLTDEQAANVEIATGTPADRLKSALLGQFVGWFLNEAGGDLDVREYDTWSVICPACLQENGGQWLTRWKLPFQFACTVHGKYFIAACASCARLLVKGH